MYYSGKYMDSFEYAMTILLVKKEYGRISNLDIMGKRSFGFWNRKDGKGYYIPLAGVKESVKSIACYAGLEERLTVWHPESVEEMIDCASEGIVYGPVEREVAVRRVKNLYYLAENRYVYIQEEPDGGYGITDPDGFPALRYSREEMKTLFGNEKGNVIRLQENDGRHRRTESIQRIWKDGWAFHRKAMDRASVTTLCQEAFSGYDGSASSQIALWYGVVNFLEHMEKLWWVKESLGISGRDSRFRRLQCAMLECAECGNAGGLPQAEAAIWKELSDEI